MQLLKYDGSELSHEPRACKLRLADVFRRPGQGITDIMTEIKSLSEKDMADFREWFTLAGYPCTAN